jgi:hypothetical protein
MPLYHSISYTDSGTQESINLDPSVVPFNACVGCTLVAGSASYKLQYSLSPMTVADADALWFDSGDIPAATITSAATGFPYPVQRVRLVIASLVTGPLVLQVLQGFSTN